jgi:NADPH:quinone reductase
VNSFGGPEVFTLTEADRPIPAATQVLIQVTVAGVNYMDVADGRLSRCAALLGVGQVQRDRFRGGRPWSTCPEQQSGAWCGQQAAGGDLTESRGTARHHDGGHADALAI